MNASNLPQILIVDDGGDIKSYCDRFLGNRYRYQWVDNGYDAIEAIKKSEPDLVLLDKNFTKISRSRLIGKYPENEGIAILQKIREFSRVPVILVTSFADPVSVRSAIKLGADDYIEWDVLDIDASLLVHRIEKVLRESRLEENLLVEKYNALGVIGRSKPMVRVFRQIEDIAKSDVTVLIIGETGTGKEVVARAIHDVSGRKPFIPVNLSALPKELVESELFGFRRGAFTGAHQDKPGFFEIAHGGTLFIDEVSELQRELQVKLLRVLEDKAFFPLGSKCPVKVDVRLIAATNQPLDELVKDGRFREDLYYRLKVYTIELPTLDERKDDIPLLIDHFVSLYSKSRGFEVYSVTEEAIEYLVTQSWPGNVRQLENCILRALTYADRILTLKDVVTAREKEIDRTVPISAELRKVLSSMKLRDLERLAIKETLKSHNWNYTEAANSLGIGRSTLYKKAEEYGIKKKGGD